MRNHSTQRRRVSPVFTLLPSLLAVLATLSLAAGDAIAASYKTIEPKLRQREATSQLGGVVLRVLSDPAAFQDAQSRQRFDQYFKEFLFPTMTLYDSNSLGSLGSLRKGFFGRNLGRAAFPEVRAHLTQMAFNEMKAIAADDFHPAVRYNAMLIIGRLDEQPANDTAKQPPVPYPDALDFLLGQLRADPATTPDAVKVGALIGIQRHSRFNLPEQQVEPTRQALVATVTAERPTDRPEEAHAWIRALGAEILAEMGELGENNNVHEALLSLVADEQMSLTARSRVAHAWKQLKDRYTADAGIDANAAVAALAKLTEAVFEYEMEEAKAFIERERAGANFDVLGEEELKYPRQRILQAINYIGDGFDAIEGALDDDLKTRVARLRTPLEEIRKVAADKKEVDIKLVGMIEQQGERTIIPAAQGFIQGEGEAEDVDIISVP